MSFSATRWPTPEGERGREGERGGERQRERQRERDRERERDESSNDGSASPPRFLGFSPPRNKRKRQGRARLERDFVSSVFFFFSRESKKKKMKKPFLSLL